MSSKNEHGIQTELGRDLGLVSALAIGVGTMIAAGIFTLSGLAIRNVGSAAIVSFLLAAIVALFTALTYCEFVSIYPRSGEGYFYARKSFPLPVAYIVGWTLFLGYTSSCAFYIASFSSYFVEFIFHTPIIYIPGIVMLILLTLLNIKGTKESGRFQVIVTIAKVLLLFWFVIGGISTVSYEEFVNRFSTDIVEIGSTATLVFITFFGFSAIAATAGEVKNPVKNIPRAIFLSMGLVTFIYTLVVLVILGAGLTEYTEAAMGVAAKKFLGSIGGMVIVAGALFSMISASNASIMASSRVTMSMSQLGHFPTGFGVISTRTRTPIVALALTGGTIGIFTIILPLEDLAHYADTVLLLALIMVNVALIVHRRKFPDIKRPFKVPLVPLIPIIGILANLYLLSQILHHILPVVLAGLSLLFGFAGFIAWKGVLAKEPELEGTPSEVALEHKASFSSTKKRILVPIANPANIQVLIRFAAAVAKQQDAEILILRVVLVPVQLPTSRGAQYVERSRHLIETATAEASKLGVAATSLIRVGHSAERAILETTKERNCSLIIMGWKGYSFNARTILGDTTDVVVKHARADIMLIKLPDSNIPTNILLPTAGGIHARTAEAMAAAIVSSIEGTLTITTVVADDASPEEEEAAEERLQEAWERIMALGLELNLEKKIIRHKSVNVGIIKEGEKHDAIMIGSAGQTLKPKFFFGSIPELVAKHAHRPVIIVKHYEPVKAIFRRVMEA